MVLGEGKYVLSEYLRIPKDYLVLIKHLKKRGFRFFEEGLYRVFKILERARAGKEEEDD